MRDNSAALVPTLDCLRNGEAADSGGKGAEQVCAGVILLGDTARAAARDAAIVAPVR